MQILLLLLSFIFGGLRSPSCTLYADSSKSVDGNGSITSPYNNLTAHTALAAGTVLCLRNGVYNHTNLVYRTNGTPSQPIIIMAYPGETATLKSNVSGGIWIQGNNWEFINLIIDNGGYFNAAIAVNSTASQFVLQNSEVKNGVYYGVDVWGTSPKIINSKIHDFYDPDKIPGNDKQCINIHGVSNNGVIQGNTIWNCWGDGIQFYNILPNNSSPFSVNWNISNNKFYRGTLGYSENSIDIKAGNNFTITANDISGYDNTGYLGTCQPAVVWHGNSQNINFFGNSIHNSCKGIELSNGLWYTTTVVNNTFTDLTQYSLEAGGARNLVFSHNTILRGGTEVIQISNEGWLGGKFDHNLIQSSGNPRLYSGAIYGGVALGPNDWNVGNSGFLAAGNDVTGIQNGFGVSSTVTPTPVSTPVPTSTPTFTPSPSPTPTATPTSSPTPAFTSTPESTMTPIVENNCKVTIYSLSPLNEVTTCS